MNHTMEIKKSIKLAKMVDPAAKVNKMQENAHFISHAQ